MQLCAVGVPFSTLPGLVDESLLHKLFPLALHPFLHTRKLVQELYDEIKPRSSIYVCSALTFNVRRRVNSEIGQASS